MTSDKHRKSYREGDENDGGAGNGLAPMTVKKATMGRRLDLVSSQGWQI